MPPSRRSAGATAAAVALMSVRDRIPDMGRVESGRAPVSAQAVPISAQVAPMSMPAAPTAAHAAPISAQSAPVSAQSAPVSAQSAPMSAQAAPVAKLGSGPADGPISHSFEEMLGRLESFYAENGRSAVLPPTSSLGVWAASQRLEKRHNLLSPEKEAALTRAGLEWSPHWSGVTWGQRYAELCEFYKKHGHCRVRYSGGGLGGWVSTQRRAKKAGRLSEERTKKLEDIGFIWDARPDGDGRGLATRPADGDSAPMPPASVPAPSRPLHIGGGSASISGSGSSVMDTGVGVGIGVGVSGASAPLSSSPRAVQWSSEGGAVSALTRAVNQAVEEREAEQAARAAAVEAAEAAVTLSTCASAPSPARAVTSEKPAGLGRSAENEHSGPPRLPAKKRHRAGGYHYSGEYSQPVYASAEAGPARSYSETVVDNSSKSVAGEDRGPSWYSAGSVEPGVTSIVTAAPRRLGDATSAPPAKRGRRQALPGVRDRVRALVGEIVAETLAPPQEAGSDTAVAPQPPDSSVRRWARETYVGMSDETLSRVVADGARHT